MPLWLGALLWGLWGIFLGSFLNVVTWRLPREVSVQGRSHCPACHYQLRWFDLLPLLSFLWLRGRCRQCGVRLSWRYPLLELLCGLLFAGVVVVVGGTSGATVLPVLIGSVIVATALVVFVTDFEHYLIFDAVLLSATLILFPLLALQSWLAGGLWWQSSVAMGLIAAGIAYGVAYLFWWATGGRALGFGDVKYLAFMGLALGPAKLATAFFVAIMLGAGVGVGLLLAGKKQLSSRIPFGTFLSFGLVIAWAFGSALVSWYLRLIFVV